MWEIVFYTMKSMAATVVTPKIASVTKTVTMIFCKAKMLFRGKPLYLLILTNIEEEEEEGAVTL